MVAGHVAEKGEGTKAQGTKAPWMIWPVASSMTRRSSGKPPSGRSSHQCLLPAPTGWPWPRMPLQMASVEEQPLDAVLLGQLLPQVLRVEAHVARRYSTRTRVAVARPLTLYSLEAPCC